MAQDFDETPPRWQVAMLGNTSAGKTCYIGSFYAFYRMGSSSDRINTSKFTVDGDSLTKGRLSEIADGLTLKQPETPDPTEKIVDYNLFLSCQGDDEVIDRELHLHDHAGEALGGSSDPAKAAMFDAVINKLKKADAFIAFLDCSKILSSEPEHVDRNTEWATMYGVLTSVAARLGRGGDTLPVVIVISKFDAAENEHEREYVLDYARKCAASLVQARNNFTLLICPTSVLKESESGRLERNLLNIPTPFFFVSAAIILRNAAWHAEQADHHRQRASAVEEQIRQRKEVMRGFFKGFLRRVLNLGLRINKVVSIDPAIGREVSLQENDIEFAENAIEYLIDDGNIKYTELIHRGLTMDISSYIEAQTRGIN